MNPNEIPIMTYPLSSAWDQPKVDDILIDHNHAVMEQKTFEVLKEYSHSNPTGVYPGKMWKLYSDKRKIWFLCWYGEESFHVNTAYCMINRRKILLVD